MPHLRTAAAGPAPPGIDLLRSKEYRRTEDGIEVLPAREFCARLAAGDLFSVLVRNAG